MSEHEIRISGRVDQGWAEKNQLNGRLTLTPNTRIWFTESNIIWWISRVIYDIRDTLGDIFPLPLACLIRHAQNQTNLYSPSHPTRAGEVVPAVAPNDGFAFPPMRMFLRSKTWTLRLIFCHVNSQKEVFSQKADAANGFIFLSHKCGQQSLSHKKQRCSRF